MYKRKVHRQYAYQHTNHFPVADAVNEHPRFISRGPEVPCTPQDSPLLSYILFFFTVHAPSDLVEMLTGLRKVPSLIPAAHLCLDIVGQKSLIPRKGTARIRASSLGGLWALPAFAAEQTEKASSSPRLVRREPAEKQPLFSAPLPSGHNEPKE